MSGHTPGEWHAAAWTRHAATTVLVDDASLVTGKRVVAECETEEDARLMTSAPKLLEALKRLTELAIGPAGGVTQADKREAIANARAAIAAATGDKS